MQKDFIYNDSFEVLKGQEYFVNGEVVFPIVESPKPPSCGLDGRYRTLFGPCVAHTGVIYGNSNHNVRLAIRRLTAVRGSKYLDAHYLTQQQVFFDQSKGFFAALKLTYSAWLEEFTGMINEAEEHHADPHPKVAARRQAWLELRLGDYKGFTSADRLWLRKVVYKMKLDEVAKPGKYPRMIADLGVAASLQGFRAVDMLKHVMAECPIDYKGGEIEFCAKPSPISLERIFTQLINPTGAYYFVYFSDDACVAIRRGEKVYVYNLDIKSCDASHGPAVFDALIAVSPTELESVMQILIDQCKLPITISDVDNFTKSREQPRRVTLRPIRPRLYTGSTITTFINNLANVAIAKSIIDYGAHDELGISKAASQAGYVVTVEKCEIIQDIQFLKYSPVLDTTGRMRPMLNVGVLLRSSGMCRGELPGRGSLELRARAFQNAYLRGMYPRCRFDLHSNLLRQTDEASTSLLRKVQVDLSYRVIDEGDVFSVSSFEVYRRYRLTPTQILELDDGFGASGFEQHHVSTGASAILFKDYGLQCKVYTNEYD